MKKKIALKFYKTHVEDGKLGSFHDIWEGNFPNDQAEGLCETTLYTLPEFKYIQPPNNLNAWGYWGGERGMFTPLRQNLVLLIAAIRGELD